MGLWLPTQKPPRGVQLAPAHPLARGLDCALLCNELSGSRIFDYSRNNRHGAHSSPEWNEGALGVSGGSYFLVPNWGAQTEFTWVVRAKIRTSVIWSYFFRITGTSQMQYLDTYYGDDLRAQVGYTDTSATTRHMAAFADGGYHTFIVTYSESGDRKIWFYIDGKKITAYAEQTASAGTISSLNSGDVRFGYNSADMSFKHVFIYHRSLTESEIAWLYREPYAMFQPAPDPRLFGYAEGSSYQDLAGTINGQASLSGLAGLIRTMAGAIPGQSTASGALSPVLGLSGAIGGQGEFQAALGLIRAISGAIDAQASVAGAVSLLRLIQGVVGAKAGASGALSLSGLIELAGLVSAQSSLSALLRLESSLAGAITGQAGLSAELRALRNIVGTLSAQSGTDGVLSPYRGLAGEVSADSGLSGTLSAILGLYGAIDARADVQGLLGLIRALSGSIEAEASLVATLLTQILGTIIDPTIESLTPRRILESLTARRTIERI